MLKGNCFCSFILLWKSKDVLGWNHCEELFVLPNPDKTWIWKKHRFNEMFSFYVNARNFSVCCSKLIHPNILIKFLQSDFTDINGYCWITQHKTSLQSCFSNLIKKPIFDLALSGIWHNKHCFQPGLKNDFRRSRISENFWTFLSCCLNVLKSKELELNQHCELPLHHSWLKSIMLKYLFVTDG